MTTTKSKKGKERKEEEERDPKNPKISISKRKIRTIKLVAFKI